MTLAEADPDAGGVTDGDAAARAALYGLLARAFDHPDERLHAGARDGSLAEEAAAYVDRSALSVSVPDLTARGDYESMAARYNRLFAIGHAEYTDRTDGSLESEGPPVPLYEFRYRDASWEAVNRDLARAYDYFGVSVDGEFRDHHDNVRLELEFAAYLARRQATGDDDAARARRDLLARHLDPFTGGLVDRFDDLAVESGVYADVAQLARRVVAADLATLRETFGDPDGGDRDG
ncbi:MAG: molecular chaperone TorD family protein [Halobacteriales archaeon]